MALEAESRLPVGSSARRTEGRWMRARATAGALKLAARELVRTMVGAIAQTDSGEEFHGRGIWRRG